MTQNLAPDVHERLLEALFSGNKIQAIKIYREATGLGLKESKDVVDRWEHDLRRTVPERFVARPASSGCVVVLVAILAFAAIAFILYLLMNG